MAIEGERSELTFMRERGHKKDWGDFERFCARKFWNMYVDDWDVGWGPRRDNL